MFPIYEHTFLPIPLHEKNKELILKFRETLSIRPDGMNHLELSRWQQNVNKEADFSLFPILDYQSAQFNNPLNFNLHLLLAQLSETTESYDDITISLNKDKSRKDIREHADDDRLQCCCSKPITGCYIVNGFVLRMIRILSFYQFLECELYGLSFIFHNLSHHFILWCHYFSIIFFSISFSSLFSSCFKYSEVYCLFSLVNPIFLSIKVTI
jgi:hypothetical protein